MTPRAALCAALALAVAAGCSPTRTEQVQAASRPEGGGCAEGSQCQSGFCARAANLLCGICRPAPKVGDSCVTAGCAQGQICVPGYSVCAVPAAAGEACSRRQPCADHLSCVGASVVGSARSGRCQPALTRAGDACDPDAQDGPSCDPMARLHCHRQRRVCEPFGVTNQLGGDCGVLGPTAVRCGPGLACLRGQCTQTAGIDQACSRGAGPVCLSPGVCHSDDAYGGSAGFCRLPGDQDCTR
jgi:hypothetical protein